MKTNIVFFDNYYESANGTLRGLICLLTLLPLYYIISKMYPNICVFSIGTPFWLLAMACGIGVIQPNNIKELVFFSICIGLIMFSVRAFWSVKNLFSIIQIKNIIFYLLIGIVLSTFTSIVLWHVYWNNNNMRISSKYNIEWQLLNVLIFCFILYYIYYYI